MDERKVSSESEFLAGKRADGSQPRHHSRELYDGPTKPFSDEPAEPPVVDQPKSAYQQRVDHARYGVEMQKLRDLDAAANYCRRMMELGFTAMDASPAGNGRGSGVEGDNQQQAAATQAMRPDEPSNNHSPVGMGEGTHATPTPEEAEAIARLGEEVIRTIPANPYGKFYAKVGSIPTPKNQTPSPAGDGTRPSRPPAAEGAHAAGAPGGRDARAPRDNPLTRIQLIAIGERGAKLLVSITEKRAEVANKLLDLAAPLDIRDAFVEDRANAVVHQTLLYMEEMYSDVGFGAWMPFRWPDQWLTFCGLLTRVLAANGLIHAKHADAYRKLLEETPPVEPEGSLQDRIKEAKTPANHAQTKRSQGARTLSELEARLEKEVWGPKEEFEKQCETMWQSNLIRKPRPQPP